MSDFREGDLVEISMGEEFARVRVGGELWKNIKKDLADWELELLHTVTLLDRPVVLPTEPGAYKFDGWGDVAVLNGLGEWYSDFGKRLHFDLKDVPRFTKLVPIPVTAKKVLDALRADADYESARAAASEAEIKYVLSRVDKIAAEFGVTE